MPYEMRRKDRMLPNSDALEILKNGKYGILSTVCENGYPYGVPMSYAYKDGKIYFHHTSDKSLISNNIVHNNKACFTVVGNTEVLQSKFSTAYESIIAFGTIHEYENKFDGLMKLVEALCPKYIESGKQYAENSLNKVTVYEFEIESVTGKARK